MVTPMHENGAMNPLPPGLLIDIADGPLSVAIAPEAGGRVAQITYQGVDWLVGYSDEHSSPVAWGSYPMVPWAGRIRRGRFDFKGQSYQLPINFGDHAIHGVGFELPWTVEHHTRTHAALSLQMPSDGRWPFGGRAGQQIEVGENWLRMVMSVTASDGWMPATFGWHPWFVKPDRVEFHPTDVYPRDEEGIATCPLEPPPPGPWDDCFVNDDPVIVHRRDQTLRLTSDCFHWVVYDEPEHATCIEPQTGPPDGLNLGPVQLPPGASWMAWFLLEWI